VGYLIRFIDPQAVHFVTQQLQGAIDFAQSESEGSTVFNVGYDESLDRLRHVYDHLETYMIQAAHKVLEIVPSLQVSIGYGLSIHLYLYTSLPLYISTSIPLYIYTSIHAYTQHRYYLLTHYTPPCTTPPHRTNTPLYHCLHQCTTAHLHHSTTLPLHTPQHHNTTTPQHHTTTPLHHYTTTPLHHYTTTPLHHYTTTPLHHHTTTPLNH
jgi:hypothetical protein